MSAVCCLLPPGRGEVEMAVNGRKLVAVDTPSLRADNRR